jgi:hypothetical protein
LSASLTSMKYFVNFFTGGNTIKTSPFRLKI